MDKRQQLAELFAQWEDCQKCELAEKRQNIVFAAGNPDADLAVIGIGPGEEEDKTGTPFSGASGEILEDYIIDSRLVQDDIILLNILGCRPYDVIMDTKLGKPVAENRDPSKIELDACRALWQQVLYICDPLVVMALGKPTVKELTRKTPTMTNDVGKFLLCAIPGRVKPVRYPVMVNYHPAFLARNGDVHKGGPWHRSAVVWRRTAYYLDVLRHAYHGTPIPDRGFKDEDLRWS